MRRKTIIRAAFVIARMIRRKTFGRTVFLSVAVVLLVLGVVREREAVVAAIARLSGSGLAWSAALALIGLAAQMLSWRAMFTGTEVGHLPLASAGRIYFLGQLGKYVPGGVWAVVAQAELGRDLHISRARSSIVALGALTVLVVVGGVVAVAGLAVGSAGSLRAYWWALLAVPVGLTALTPRVFNRVTALVLGVVRRGAPAPVPTVHAQALLRSSAWAVVMWLAFGAHAWFLAADLGAHGWADAATVGGAFALAWVVGFVVVIAPAGAGPREAALVVALTPVMDAPDALVVALVSRVLMVAGDAAAAAVFARARSQSRQHRP